MDQRGRTVAVTGIGAFSPVGRHPGPMFEALLAGRSGTRLIDRFDVSTFPAKVAGFVDDFNPEEFMKPRDAQVMDRCSLLAIGAATLAAKDAGLTTEMLAEAAAIVGSGFGAMASAEESFYIFKEKGVRGTKPFTIPRAMPNAPAAAVSMALGAKGPHYILSSACASGTMAIGQAMRMIRHGQIDVALAGGADAPITAGILSGWCAMRVASKRNDEPASACRPFSDDRDGLVAGEGAAFLVLEELGRAKARGAKILALVSGAAETSDAGHITAPSVAGEARAIREAIEDADLEPEDIDYVNAHGTATDLNDRCETAALKEALGARARTVPISATKSMIGHAIGGGGAIEAAATILSIGAGKIHPTANYKVPDPECDLDYVTTGAREVAIRHALKLSFGFGGANAALVFSNARNA